MFAALLGEELRGEGAGLEEDKTAGLWWAQGEEALLMTKLGVEEVELEEVFVEELVRKEAVVELVGCMMGEELELTDVFSLLLFVSMLVMLVMTLLLVKFCICDKVRGCDPLGRYRMGPSIFAMLLEAMKPFSPAMARKTLSGFKLPCRKDDLLRRILKPLGLVFLTPPPPTTLSSFLTLMMYECILVGMEIAA